MNRRSLLKSLAALPLLGWLKPVEALPTFPMTTSEPVVHSRNIMRLVDDKGNVLGWWNLVRDQYDPLVWHVESGPDGPHISNFNGGILDVELL